MNILITGGAGFVGSNLAISLKTKYPQYKITAFDNLRRRGSELNLKKFQEMDIEFIHGDIRNIEDLESIEFNLLIEACAEPSVMAGLDGSRKYLIDTNLNGLVNSLEVALQQKAKVIFLSTSRVYPMEVINSLNYEESDTRYSLHVNDISGVSEKGFSEELSLSGYRTLYGATKLSSEYIIDEYVHMFGLQAIINRSGVIAGAGQFGKVDQGFMTLWAANYYFNKPLSIFGNGKQVRDILNINDLFDLIDLQIHSFEKFSSQRFNIGGGLNSSVSLLELDAMCKKLLGQKSVACKEQRALDLKYYVSDNSKIKSFGWEPKRSVEDTLKQIVSWIEQNEKELKWIFA
jgi:CDP-paratose 2-epimerase